MLNRRRTAASRPRRSAPAVARRGLALAAAALALTAATQAATASADPNFGAGILPNATVTEGGAFDYTATLPPCDAAYQCIVGATVTSGPAILGTDFAFHHPNSQFVTAADGPITVDMPITTIQDKLREGDESFMVWFNVDTYESQCQRHYISDVCRPTSTWRWGAIVTIHDDEPVFRPATKVSAALPAFLGAMAQRG